MSHITRSSKVLGICLILIYLTGCSVMENHLAYQAVKSLVSGPEPKSCHLDRGSCFDLAIDGQLATPLSKQEKQTLVDRLMLQHPHYTECSSCGGFVSRVAWQVTAPVKDGMSVETIPNTFTAEYFGEKGVTSRVDLLPLNGQDINVASALVTDPSVRIGGAAMVGKRTVIAQDTLPPGEYLMHIRLNGVKGGRDAKYVYFIVES